MTPAFLTSELGDDPIITEATLPAPPARVFKAWTDPTEIPRWFGQERPGVESAQIDLRVGGRWLFTFSAQPDSYSALGGEYLVIQPAELLVFTWCHEGVGETGQRERSPVSQVSVAFAPVPAGTHLTLTHENIASASARHNICHGWSASMQHLLDSLGDALPATG